MPGWGDLHRNPRRWPAGSPGTAALPRRTGAAGRHGAHPGRARAALAAPPSGSAHAGREAGVCIATAFRYLPEALDVIAAHAPALDDVLADAHAAGLPFLVLDGTLVPTDRVAARAERGHHLWYSGKHHAFGGNVQVVFDPT